MEQKQILSLVLMLFSSTLSYGLVPKSVIKLGWKTFWGQLTEPSEESLCFNVIENLVNEMFHRDTLDFEDAIKLALGNADMAHSTVDGTCEKAYRAFLKKFSSGDRVSIQCIATQFYVISILAKFESQK